MTPGTLAATSSPVQVETERQAHRDQDRQKRDGDQVGARTLRRPAQDRNLFIGCAIDRNPCIGAATRGHQLQIRNQKAIGDRL
jgi:hypothetical protein